MRLTRSLLKKRQQENAPFVFYLHPWELDPDQPKIEDASIKSKFRHYVNLGRVSDRLHRLLSDFKFAPMGEVLDGCERLTTHQYH